MNNTVGGHLRGAAEAIFCVLFLWGLTILVPLYIKLTERLVP